MSGVTRPIALLTALTLLACGGVDHQPYDTRRATKQLPVVLVSQTSDLSPELNRRRMEEHIVEAMAEHPDVRVIAFGEASLGWYFKSLDPTYQRTVAEALDGTTVTLMRRLARERHVVIAFGFAERAEDKIFDAAVIIDDQGEVIAHRRKSNFVPMDESSGFTRGEKVMTTATIDGIKFAFLICNDFNEAAYQAQFKADPEIKVVLLPQASAGLTSATVRNAPYPFEGAWLLAPQRVGKENDERYHGSWLLDPNGYIVAAAEGAEGSLYALVAVE